MKARFLQPQVSTVGLVAHWKLDGSGFDYSLNGYPGTLTGTAPVYKYPGIDLPGTDEHIVIDDTNLVAGGTFDDWDSVGARVEDPTGWIVVGESGNDPEVSEAATGEAHADTPTLGGGMCNLYSSSVHISISRTWTAVVGRKYGMSINVDTATSGSIYARAGGGSGNNQVLSTAGIHTWSYVAANITETLIIGRNDTTTDITFDDVSITLADFTPVLTPFSISAWVKMDSATNFVIASKFITATTAREWRFNTQATDLLLFLLFDETNDKTITRYYSVALTAYQGIWIHVAATYSGGTLDSSIKIYINGARVDDANLGSGGFVSCRNTAADIKIGNYDAIFANGIIDDVMTFNLEKSAADIKSIYEVTRGGYGA